MRVRGRPALDQQTAYLLTNDNDQVATTPAPPPRVRTPLNRRSGSADSASADSTSGPSVDDQGNPTSFNASNLIDGLVETAWRADGDAAGQEIRFFFSTPVHLTSVGLIPGYDKTDPLTGVDRFPQYRRVSTVEWTTVDGDTVAQDLADDRSPQFIDVDAVTSMVTIRIVSTLSPGDPRRDFTPISEVFFQGQQT